MKVKTKVLLALGGLVVAAGVAGGFYIANGVEKYSTVFYNGTAANIYAADGTTLVTTLDISELTVEEARARIDSAIDGYTLTINGYTVAAEEPETIPATTTTTAATDEAQVKDETVEESVAEGVVEAQMVEAPAENTESVEDEAAEDTAAAAESADTLAEVLGETETESETEAADTLAEEIAGTEEIMPIEEGADTLEEVMQSEPISVDVLEGENIALHFSEEQYHKLDELLADQDCETWFLHMTAWGQAGNSQTVDVQMSYDADKLSEQLKSLTCISPAEADPGQNAYLEYEETSGLYRMVDEVLGNVGDYEKILEKVTAAADSFARSLNLTTEDYVWPEITHENEELNANLEKVNKYLSACITLTDGPYTQVIDGKVIVGFLDIDENYNVTIDQEKIRDYIRNTLDPLFDTKGITRTVTTVGSGTFTVSGGTFGKVVRTAEELPLLLEEIENGEVIERAPCYYENVQTTYDNGGIGDTYIDVNIEKQHVWVVKDGEVAIETDCVTGKSSEGRDTPTGTYYVIRKVRNHTMVKYDSFVYYWMPINDSNGVGLHDATWRSKFGGTIYKTNGSHGCINLPSDKAKEIYEFISAGIPVVVH